MPPPLPAEPLEPTAPGRIEVITGPMFSGKSEELIRRLKRAGIARQSLICFKPQADLRYGTTAITSHSRLTFEAQPVDGVEALRAELWPQLDRIDVVGVDEAQFFAPTLVVLALELVARGKRVLLAGLDMTFDGQPFEPVPALMAIADEVLKLAAVCTVCGEPAIHSQRLGTNRERVMVGGEESYEARCRAHFGPETPALPQ